MDNEPTLSDLVADRIRKLLKQRGMTVRQLAARCRETGSPKLTDQALYKLLGQRERQPRPVSVDELAELAVALQVTAASLAPELLRGLRFGDLDASCLGEMTAMADEMRRLRARMDNWLPPVGCDAE
jgi:transcriptional regulator with XRE-family HTH domain